VSTEWAIPTEQQRVIRALMSGALLGWVLAILARRRRG
jgi:hypothetical protein